MANIELHVHPFLNNNTIIEVADAMDKTGIDILALEELDNSLYPRVLEEAKSSFQNIISDGVGFKLPDGKYILNAREYNTRENFHILTVGYSLDKANSQTEIRRIIDEGLNHGALIVLDHPFIDNRKTKTAGHIPVDMEQDLEKLCKEYSGQLALEWNGYCIPWMRKALKSGLNLAGFDIQYHDVNQAVEQLSAKLGKEGYNVPVVADTDLHARTKRHLQQMGTSRILTDIEGECASDIVSSMKRNIFNGNYENVKNYVTPAHLLSAFCFPILFPNHFKKPRA